MTVWFTSDTHYGHAMVAAMRGFDSAQEHDDALMTHWAATVKKDDLVWVLGDLVMHRWAYGLQCIKSLPGRKRVIWGNHDHAHPMHTRAPKFAREAAEVFEYQSAFARTKLHGQAVWLSHFPHADPPEEADRVLPIRHPELRLPDTGGWLLHGHTHRADQRLHGRQIHVGVDAWDFAPVADDVLHGMITEAEAGRLDLALAAEPAPPPIERCAVCGRPEDQWPMAMRGTGVCCEAHRKTRAEILGLDTQSL